SKTVMAHCIHSSEAETQLLKDTGVYIAHCPSSNTNVRSGLCPTKKYMDAGMHIGLGSDISGGNTLDMAQVIRDALGVSKQLSYLSGCSYLSSSEAFWLATKGGGSFFGKAGSFEEGYSFDAVVIDDSAYCLSGELPLDKRFEKLIYQSSNADITAKYVCGRRIF
ncbi:MAG: amidohydrolase family protein, partial [Oscillospiraceae bacterium]|nr:amidohydrolase family protein [Oscillospiraceae bacterium]